MFIINSTKEPCNTKVVVAMSGGVDSSYVAAQMKLLGYDVIGITLQLYDQGEMLSKKGACCAGQDIYDAKMVADKFNFPHYILDYESKFKKSVIDDFADSYIRGETPLPCVRCNQSVKFHDLLDIAKNLEADMLVTGHYVKKIIGNNGAELHKAIDHKKDQSYFLFATTADQLSFLEFPLGNQTKDETRRQAINIGLAIADKPDSQDICFVPNGSYADIVSKIRPNAIKAGVIMHIDGYSLGKHDGIINYTIGQRRGLGVATGEALYVVKIDAEENIVYVGPESALSKICFTIKDYNWIGPKLELGEELDVSVKIRSTHQGARALIRILDKNYISVKLFCSAKAITPGQACVIYDDTRVLGGGWITRDIN